MRGIELIDTVKKIMQKSLKIAGFFLFLLSLTQLTSQIALLLTGLFYWASPWTWLVLIRHGFYLETILAFFILSSLIALSLSLTLKGFSRYLASLTAGLLFTILILLFIGYFIFSLIYLDSFQGFLGPSELLWKRQQEAILWQSFIQVEAILFSLALITFVLYSFEHLRPARKILGQAHFSNGFETQRAGFFKAEEQSIIIGQKYKAPLYANGFEHVLVFAPTGSGKTRSIGIPNLFSYPYSVVCNDVKLTLFKTTSGYREQILGHRCFCWAPASETRKTHAYNPLSLISKDKLQRLTDIQRMAHILMPDSKKSDPIWQQASRKLFKVVLLYLLDTPERLKTLGEINRLIKQPGFDEWLSTQLEETEHLDPEFYRNGYSYLNNHEKTRSSILETFSGYFELFDDPTIDAATSRSDFDLRTLRREKISLYIGFSDDDMERLSPLLTLFWQQLISVMIKNIPDPKEEPYPLLCLIDEFSSLGRIERLRRSLKLLREYRVRCILILQYIAQTYEQYSHDEAKAFTNIKTKIAFATEDLNDAEYISKLLGTKTVKVFSGSVRAEKKSINYQYQTSPLMRPDEVMKMGENQTLILQTGKAPVKAKQLIWYQHPTMKFLPRAVSEVPIQKVEIYPFTRPTFLNASTLETLET